MNMTDKEVMQMALDALEKHIYEYETIQALRAALTQPEKEWVGLTDVDLIELIAFTHMTIENVRSVEAKLKDKNNAA